MIKMISHGRINLHPIINMHILHTIFQTFAKVWQVLSSLSWGRGEGGGGWQRLIQKGNKPCRKKESKENSVNNKPGTSDFNLTFTLFSKPLIWLIPPTKGLGELLTSLSGCVFYWHWLKNINFLLTKRAPWRILAGDCGSMDWVVLCP